MKTPKTYLSVTNGNYRVIHQELPINADSPDIMPALISADRYKLKLSKFAWNGREFVSRDNFIHCITHFDCLDN